MIVTKLNLVKKIKKGSCKAYKTAAHKSYRRSAKQAIKAGKEINEKPRLTAWHII